jgi:hypothetical protein
VSTSILNDGENGGQDVAHPGFESKNVITNNIGHTLIESICV